MVAVASSPAVIAIETPPSLFPAKAPRLVSVDVLRGLVMVSWRWITPATSSAVPAFLPRTWPTPGALFFTRIITHYCAPVFAFLAGTGAFLSTSRGKSVQPVSWFFFTRGLWLVLLELTIVDFAWGFVPWIQAGVIWILGWSMVAMALIVRLPAPLDRGAGTLHDRDAQLARSCESRFVRKVLLVVDPAALPRTVSRSPITFSFPPGTC